MSRLVAFGCSCTFGYQLPDASQLSMSWQDDGLPSKFAWPQIAADMLGRECLNLSHTGNSNINITKSILDFPWARDDICCVLWSYINRDSIYGDDEPSMLEMGTWQLRSSTWSDMARKFYELHSDRDMALRSWLYQHTVGLHLKAAAIPFAMGSMEAFDLRHKVGEDHRNVSQLHFREPFVDYAADGRHPGMQTHMAWAHAFYRVFAV